MDSALLREQSLQDIIELLEEHALLCGGNYLSLSPQSRAEKAHLAPCYDSRLLEPHHLFVAIAGEYFDGHNFISIALEKKVKAVICQTLPESSSASSANLAGSLNRQDVAILQVSDSRQALSLLSASCFVSNLQVLGVTGTDGKSSIAYLIYQILRRNYKVGLLSTFGLDFGDNLGDNLGDGLEANPMHQTTPESLLVHRALARMQANGCKYAILECSSHGLSPKTARLQHVEFAGAVFSNLSPEHLEFHGTMECYARDKASLFARLRPGAVAVWNSDEASSEVLYAAAAMPEGILQVGYATEPQNTCGHKNALPNPLPDMPRKEIPFSQIFLARNIKLQIDGSQFELLAQGQIYNCHIGIPGSVYVSNTLAALALCCAIQPQKTLPDVLQDMLQSSCDAKSVHQLALRAPEGRMQVVVSSAPFSVLIDYAHSPGAFARLLPEMRALLGSKQKLLVLFGSGGQRDRKKRPLQGKIAAEYADVIVLCDEDPRDEAPSDILTEIQAGIPHSFRSGENLFLLPDRREAIRKILSLAEKQDLVLLLGKGHETSMIVAGLQELPWNELKVTQEVLQNMGYSQSIEPA